MDYEAADRQIKECCGVSRETRQRVRGAPNCRVLWSCVEYTIAVLWALLEPLWRRHRTSGRQLRSRQSNSATCIFEKYHFKAGLQLSKRKWASYWTFTGATAVSRDCANWSVLFLMILSGTALQCTDFRSSYFIWSPELFRLTEYMRLKLLKKTNKQIQYRCLFPIYLICLLHDTLVK